MHMPLNYVCDEHMIVTQVKVPADEEDKHTHIRDTSVVVEYGSAFILKKVPSIGAF